MQSNHRRHGETGTFTRRQITFCSSLGADIGINFHTVNKAYQILKQEGFIQIHRQKGVVIHPDGVAKADELFLLNYKRS